MKLLVTSMVIVSTLSMGVFIGAFQACTNDANIVDDVVGDANNTIVGDAANTVKIVDTGILDIVPAEELLDSTVEVEVLVFTEEETQDVLYSDKE